LEEYNIYTDYSEMVIQVRVVYLNWKNSSRADIHKVWIC
jgi:hypothetical protein